MFRSAIEGIKKRGDTDLGDKTLLDALCPRWMRWKKHSGEGRPRPWRSCCGGPPERRSHPPHAGQAGRAAYTGERSIGTLDAGAVAMAVLFEAVARPGKTGSTGKPHDLRKTLVN